MIKDKEQVPLERFIFSIETMIEIDAFNKDTRSVELSAKLIHHYLTEGPLFLVLRKPLLLCLSYNISDHSSSNST